jgi:hypothetical protein
MVVSDISYSYIHRVSGTISEVMTQISATLIDPWNIMTYWDDGTDAVCLTYSLTPSTSGTSTTGATTVTYGNYKYISGTIAQVLTKMSQVLIGTDNFVYYTDDGINAVGITYGGL